MNFEVWCSRLTTTYKSRTSYHVVLFENDTEKNINHDLKRIFQLKNRFFFSSSSPEKAKTEWKMFWSFVETDDQWFFSLIPLCLDLTSHDNLMRDLISFLFDHKLFSTIGRLTSNVFVGLERIIVFVFSTFSFYFPIKIYLLFSKRISLTRSTSFSNLFNDYSLRRS